MTLALDEKGATVLVPLEAMMLWDVVDAAKKHVAFAHAHARRNTLRRESKGSFDELHVAVRTWSSLRTHRVLSADASSPAAREAGAHGVETSEQGPMVQLSAEEAAIYQTTPEQMVSLEDCAWGARLYVQRCVAYQKAGHGIDGKRKALLHLCKALDVLTFYRTGPDVRDEIEEGPQP